MCANSWFLLCSLLQQSTIAALGRNRKVKVSTKTSVQSQGVHPYGVALELGHQGSAGKVPGSDLHSVMGRRMGEMPVV